MCVYHKRSIARVKFTLLVEFDMTKKTTKKAIKPNLPQRPTHWVNLAQSAIDRHKQSLNSAHADKMAILESAISQKECDIETKKQFISDYLTLGYGHVNSVVLSALERDLKALELSLVHLNAAYSGGFVQTFASAMTSGGESLDNADGQRPPHSNTGGIDVVDNVIFNLSEDLSEEFLLLDDGKTKVRVPRPNLDVSPKSAFIDWLTFTFKVSDFYSSFPESRAISNDGLDLVCEVSAKLDKALGFSVTSKRSNGLWFYKHCYDLGDKWGNLCIGGQNDTICIAINGQGCLAAKKGWEKRLKAFGEKVGARITRADLAHDFFYGEYSVDKADLDDDNGLFSLGARSPKVQHLGNWKRPDNSGRTLMIGSRDAGKLLRIYEKGRQLGGIYSDMFADWVRVELELHSKDRVIPWAVLLDAGQYLAGSYPALAFIDDSQQRIKTKKNIVKSTIDKAKNVVKAQFGRYLWIFHELYGNDGLHDLFIKETPKRLIVPHWDSEFNPPPLTMPVFSIS